MASSIKLIILATALSLCFVTAASADLNKCVDPKTRKAFFTDGICPEGQQREKSIATNAYSSRSFSNSDDDSNDDPRVKKLRSNAAQATRELEKANVDYRFARNNYTDPRAIHSAQVKLYFADKEWARHKQAYLDASNPRMASQFRQQREAIEAQEQQELQRLAAAERAREEAYARHNAEQEATQEITRSSRPNGVLLHSEEQARDQGRPQQLLDPYSGTVMNRGAGGYVDPRSGTFHQDAAGGVVNTRTGRFNPTN